MTDHMPECIYEPQHFDPEQNIVWGGKPCICEEIKRAEKRVLDAAREAVAALDIGRDVRFSVDVQAEALAAIDALRLKP